MINYIAISQSLEPKVIQQNDSTYFCFTVVQSKKLAKLIELGNYNDTLVKKLTTTNWKLQLVSDTKDNVIDFKNQKLSSYATIVEVWS